VKNSFFIFVLGIVFFEKKSNMVIYVYTIEAFCCISQKQNLLLPTIARGGFVFLILQNGTKTEQLGYQNFIYFCYCYSILLVNVWVSGAK